MQSYTFNISEDDSTHTAVSAPTPVITSLAGNDDSQAVDEYMKRFESIDNQGLKLRETALLLKKQPDQDHRLLKVLHFIEQQQKWNEDIYDLLVEMNNFFAPK